jgi:hypothetical protein
MLVTVQTAYGFNITVHPAYASKFLKFFALLKERGYKVPANITKCWARYGTHVPGSNHYIGAACDIQTGWNRSTIAVISKRSVARTTERPTFTPPWKNSNRNNRQQTINHEHLQERFVVCATTFGQTKHGPV